MLINIFYVILGFTAGYFVGELVQTQRTKEALRNFVRGSYKVAYKNNRFHRANRRKARVLNERLH